MVDGLRIDHRPEHVDRALVHMGGEAADLVGAQVVRLHHLLQGVGGRMGVPARGVELERGLGQRPALAQAVDQAGRIGVARHARCEALRTLEDAARPGEPFEREIGRHQAAGGGVGGVELLGVGRVAQELPEAGRLGAGRAEGMQHPLGRQPQQMAGGGRGGEGPGGAGGVEGPVVRAAEELADPDADLVADDRSRQQLATGPAEGLRHGQRRRKDDRCGMEHRAVVHVVLLGEMRGRRVHHRREQGRAAAAADQDLRRALVRPHRAAPPGRSPRPAGRPCRPGRSRASRGRGLRSGGRPVRECFRSAAARRSRRAFRSDGRSWEGSIHRACAARRAATSSGR